MHRIGCSRPGSTTCHTSSTPVSTPMAQPAWNSHDKIMKILYNMAASYNNAGHGKKGKVVEATVPEVWDCLRDVLHQTPPPDLLEVSLLHSFNFYVRNGC